VTGIQADFPPPHWDNNTLMTEYTRSAAEYRKIWTVTPEQNMEEFERADILLKDAQDIRDALAKRGIDTPGVLLP